MPILNNLQNKITLAVLGTVSSTICLIASCDKALQKRYLLNQNNISKVTLSFGAVMLASGTWLYCHQIEKDLEDATSKTTNQQQLKDYYEALKVENATYKMGLDAQIARAKADFVMRQELALLRQDMGYDLSEQAEHHLEEMQLNDRSADVPDHDSGTGGNAYSVRAERLKAVLLEKLKSPENPPLFENLERVEKLEMLQLVLNEDLGIEDTILLCWGIKRGGRNHDKYQDARAMFETMKKELEGSVNNEQ